MEGSHVALTAAVVSVAVVVSAAVSASMVVAADGSRVFCCFVTRDGAVKLRRDVY